MGTGRWGGRGSDLAGARDAPSPAIAEDAGKDDIEKQLKQLRGELFVWSRRGPGGQKSVQEIKSEIENLERKLRTADDNESAEETMATGRRGGRPSDKTGARDRSRAIATDPPVSEAERRALGAAASGNSNLGIPQSVGKESIEKDPGGKLPARAKKQA